jgi:hypothetical protein
MKAIARALDPAFALQRTRQRSYRMETMRHHRSAEPHAVFHGLFHIRNLHRVDGL